MQQVITDHFASIMDSSKLRQNNALYSHTEGYVLRLNSDGHLL